MITEHLPSERALHLTIYSMVAASPNGLTPQECQDKYTRDFGPLNINKLGFISFAQLLQSIPTIYPFYSSTGTLLYRSEIQREKDPFVEMNERHERSLKNTKNSRTRVPLTRKSTKSTTDYKQMKLKKRVQESSEEVSLSSSGSELAEEFVNKKESSEAIDNLAKNMNELIIEKADQEQKLEVVEKEVSPPTPKKEFRAPGDGCMVANKLRLKALLEETNNFNKTVDRKVFTESRIAFDEIQLMGKEPVDDKVSKDLEKLIVSNSHIPVKGRGPGFGRLRSGRSGSELDEVSASRSSNCYDFEEEKWPKLMDGDSDRLRYNASLSGSRKIGIPPRFPPTYRNSPSGSDNRFGNRERYPGNGQNTEAMRSNQYQSPRAERVEERPTFNRALSSDKTNNFYTGYDNNKQFGNARNSRSDHHQRDFNQNHNSFGYNGYKESRRNGFGSSDRSAGWRNERTGSYQARSVEPVVRKPDPDDPLVNVNVNATPVRHQYYTMLLCGNLQNGSIAKRIEKTVRNTEDPPRFF